MISISEHIAHNFSVYACVYVCIHMCNIYVCISVDNYCQYIGIWCLRATPEHITSYPATSS